MEDTSEERTFAGLDASNALTKLLFGSGMVEPCRLLQTRQ